MWYIDKTMYEWFTSVAKNNCSAASVNSERVLWQDVITKYWDTLHHNSCSCHNVFDTKCNAAHLLDCNIFRVAVVIDCNFTVMTCISITSLQALQTLISTHDTFWQTCSQSLMQYHACFVVTTASNTPEQQQYGTLICNTAPLVQAGHEWLTQCYGEHCIADWSDTESLHCAGDASLS